MIAQLYKPQYLKISFVTYTIICILCLVLSACGSDDGNESTSKDYFNSYLPEELPLSTHQTELVWQSRISSNTGGSIVLFNELLSETGYAVISSDTKCTDYLWLFYFVVPVDFCLTDYAYIARVPLGIGVNPITVTAYNSTGLVEDTKTYIVKRQNYLPEPELEPNDDYYDAEYVSPPIVIQGEVGNDGSYDTFTITADTTRDYTVVITGAEDVTATEYTPYPTREFPSFTVEDIYTEKVTDSNDDKYFFSGVFLNGRYANFSLEAEERVFITVCCSGEYLLGIF